MELNAEKLPVNPLKSEFHQFLIENGYVGSYKTFAKELHTALFPKKTDNKKARYKKRLTRGEMRKFLKELEE